MSGAERPGDAYRAKDKRLPPVVLTGVVSLALAVSAVIYLNWSLPRVPPIAPAVGLLVASALTVALNGVALARTRGFAWRPFFLVYKWTSLGYGIIAGLLMFVFVRNELPARQLVLLVATLAIGAVDIPMILSFSVARFVDDVDQTEG